MSALATTLSSAGTATAVILDPVKKATTVQATVTSGGSAASLFVQFTLDDPTSIATGSSVVWANLSSALTSSGLDTGGGIVYTVLSPLGGLRLSSTTFTSGTVTLKALQTVTG